LPLVGDAGAAERLVVWRPKENPATDRGTAPRTSFRRQLFEKRHADYRGDHNTFAFATYWSPIIRRLMLPILLPCGLRGCLASYAICLDRRTRIRPPWHTTRRRSSHPRPRPSLRPPSRNIRRWQWRAPIRPNSERSRRIRKLQLLACPSRRRSDRRALSRKAYPRARRLPYSVARRRPSPSEASRAASALRVKPDRQTVDHFQERCPRG
jgi:hypothetical protein